MQKNKKTKTNKQKKQKSPMYQFFIIPEIILGPFWTTLGSKTSKLTFFPKRFCKINFKTVNQKIMCTLSYKTWKTSFWEHSRFARLKNLKIRFFPKKSFKVIARLYVDVISCKKSEIFHELIFHKTWKPSFLAHFGPFCLKTSK